MRPMAASLPELWGDPDRIRRLEAVLSSKDQSRSRIRPGKCGGDRRYAAAEGFLFGADPERLPRRRGASAPAALSASYASPMGRAATASSWRWRGLEVLSVDISPDRARPRPAPSPRTGPGAVLAFEEANLATWQWPRDEFDAVVAIFIQFAGHAARPRGDLCRDRRGAEARRPSLDAGLSAGADRLWHRRTAGSGEHVHRSAATPSLRRPGDPLAPAHDSALSEGKAHRASRP